MRIGQLRGADLPIQDKVAPHCKSDTLLTGSVSAAANIGDNGVPYRRRRVKTEIIPPKVEGAHKTPSFNFVNPYSERAEALPT